MKRYVMMAAMLAALFLACDARETPMEDTAVVPDGASFAGGGCSPAGWLTYVGHTYDSDRVQLVYSVDWEDAPSTIINVASNLSGFTIAASWNFDPPIYMSHYVYTAPSGANNGTLVVWYNGIGSINHTPQLSAWSSTSVQGYWPGCGSGTALVEGMRYMD